MNRFASLLLPAVTLALTVGAFLAGAPVKMARLAHPPAPVAALEFDSSIRYEPAISSELGGFHLVGAKRVLDELVSEHLLALK